MTEHAEEVKYHTYFIDIDGTILKYRNFGEYDVIAAEPTPGAVEKLNEIHAAGHMIVLTTARPEDRREITLRELAENKVPYDRLVMGLARGRRHLINDRSPKDPGVDRAIGWNIERDAGLADIAVELV